MAKSVNDYYSEKMKKLLEMQKAQNAAQLSSPAQQGRTADVSNDQSTGRGYYDSFRMRTAPPAKTQSAPNQGKARSKNRNPLERDVIDDVRKGKSPSNRNGTQQSAKPGAESETIKRTEKTRPRINPEQTVEDRFEEYLKQVEAVRAAKRARTLRKVRDSIVSFLLITAVFTVMCVVVYRLLFVINDISAVGGVDYTSEELVEASGVEKGDHLFSFSSREIGELMTLRCPELSEVDVERTPPGKIVFNVTEEPPRFYCDFYGEYRMLSPTLRVLASVTESDAKSKKCIKIILPDISRATAGLAPEFCDVKDDSYIFSAAAAVLNSSLGDRAGTLDVSDKYNMTLTVDGKYILKLGDSESIETKLRIAAAVLENEMFDKDIKATIDVTDLSESSVVEDPGLKVD